MRQDKKVIPTIKRQGENPSIVEFNRQTDSMQTSIVVLRLLNFYCLSFHENDSYKLPSNHGIISVPLVTKFSGCPGVVEPS